ncbi:MAG: hypothetical protein AB7G25_05940 [Sphingomonadaceae bacterium]
MKPALIAASVAACVSAAALLPATPALAQRDAKVLIVYGDDQCPTSNGEEIVVCSRKPESERYRIPEELRDTTKTPAGPNWTERAMNLEYVGQRGTSSCTPGGGGGDWTGCWSKLMREARAERKAASEGEPELP